MPFYTPSSPWNVGHHVRHGFLSMASLHKLDADRGYRPSRNYRDPSCRTLVFDTPERAAEWWAGAYGTEIVLLEIDGDVTIEEGNTGLLEGMYFLTGEIPADQVSRYEAPTAVPGA